jgi:TonB-linked SusC/RagA family outer membrane protein
MLGVAVALGSAAPPAVAQTTGRIQGEVRATGSLRPLSGAQVFIPGTGTGTLTGADGKFVLRVPVGSVTLRVQMIGFQQGEQTVTVGAGDAATANFELSEQAVTLDEVVVTGTAAPSRRKEVGNAIAAISTQQLTKAAPIANTQEILTGRTSGATVLANGGQPGAGGTIRLRGINSISQSNSPVIYVDGVRIYSDLVPTGEGGRQGYLALNDVSASDIERVEIVKGAAATTLYGTEAAGGVIQIFTKKGAQGPPVWNAEVVGGFNNQGHLGDKKLDPAGVFINNCSEKYSRYVNLSASSATYGQTLPFVDATCPESGTYLRNGPIQRYNLSVRGGAEGINYFFSGNYADENGTLPTSQNRDGGVRGNFTFFPLPNLSINFNSGYTKRRTNWAQDGDNSEALLLNAARGQASYMDAGKGNDCERVPTGVPCVANGYVFDAQAWSAADHFITGLTVSFNPSQRFMNRLTFGYDYNNQEHVNHVPWGWVGSGQTDLGLFDQQTKLHTKLSVDYAGSFQHSFTPALASTFSWGGQLFEDRDRWTDVYVEGFAGPGEPTLGAATHQEVAWDEKLRYINAGFFLQEMLGWQDRFFVTLGLRMDGVSSFGDKYGLTKYPKVSAAYVLSEHEWWPSWIETFKVRAALGESGKAPGAFDAVRTWRPVSADDDRPAFTPGQIGNPRLGPERTREAEIGFDASAFAGRLGLEVSYFNARTRDALIPVSYPPSLGFTRDQIENVGVLENRGLELHASLGLLRTNTLDWRARGNFTKLSSKVVNLGEYDEIYLGYNGYVKVGYPIVTYWGRKVLNPDAIADPILSEKDEMLGAVYPDRTFGVGTSVTLYNRLTLDVLGEGQFGGHLENDVAWNGSFRGNWYPCMDVQQKKVQALGADRKKGTADDNPAALAGVSALWRARCPLTRAEAGKNYWTEPTDFFKLRSVALSFDLPQGWVPRASAASLTLAGRNLFAWTKYSGPDPEVNDVTDAGINRLERRDYFVFPPSRSFTAALRLTF